MVRVIFLTHAAFQELAQALEGKRYANTSLADAGYANLSVDPYGDWVVMPEHSAYHAGQVVSIEALVPLAV